MTPFPNERHEIFGYRQDEDGQVKIRDKHGELVGWTAFGQTRAEDGTVVSFQENEGLLYKITGCTEQAPPSILAGIARLERMTSRLEGVNDFLAPLTRRIPGSKEKVFNPGK